MLPIEINCYDPNSLIQDLNNRFACPCHAQTVIYKVPGGSFRVKVEVEKSNEIMKRTVSISQTTFYQIGNQLVGCSGTVKIEVEGKSAKSKMSFKKEDSQVNLQAFSEAIQGFKKLYNTRWNKNPFAYPEGHEQSAHYKEIKQEPREYFQPKNQPVISVKN